ncbi:hypothetical protein BT96DRAFT_922400 [Gymnopus androsaceus JB14]|uniref:Uncharacterized protein n=1 Tax=Gymnopus androsaceus JB14 TaxID=1447944 RepID=A0A6A4HFQ7_9AGAR|nr:hypothetical protein BT96DRAFT_922400 [Gymnopus androsaceus JB14]
MRRAFQPRLSLHSHSLSLSTDLTSQISPGIPSSSLHAGDLSGSSPTTPQPTKTHFRRKTYAGDLALDLGNANAIRDYEERIALLESQNARISVELRATQQNLVDEREDRQIQRQSFIMSAPSSTSHAQIADSHLNEHSEILYERKLRMEILDSLKKVRTENMTISRSLRECQDNYASLTSVLEVEQKEKEELREEIKKLSQKNFMLYEHNMLLVGRDSALQEEISSLMTKSQADDWMRGVLEEELQTARQSSPTKKAHSHISAHVKRSTPAPSITLEHQGPLRAQLVTACDELHVARRCLEASEKRCTELDSRTSSLQREMSQCLDSSAQALDVERDLRAEVEEYARKLEEENARLKDELDYLRESDSRQKDPVTHADAVPTNIPVETMEASSSKLAEFSEGHIPHKILCGDVQKITVDVRNVTLSPAIDESTSDDMITADTEAALKARRRERLLERQLRLSSSKRIARRRSSVRSRSALFASVASPTITDAPVTVFQSMVHSFIPSPSPWLVLLRRDSLKPLQLAFPELSSSSRSSSPVLNSEAVEARVRRDWRSSSRSSSPALNSEAVETRVRRESLKPLHLRSPESKSSSRCSSPALNSEAVETRVRRDSFKPLHLRSPESKASSRSSSLALNSETLEARDSFKPLQLAFPELGSSSRSSSPGLNSEVVGTRAARRDSLKPLQLSSPESVSSNKLKRLTLHNPSFCSVPTSDIAFSPILPPVPPSTPKKQKPARKWSDRFPDGTPTTGYYPESPDSPSATLVAPSPASAHVDLRKSLMISTTLSKKSSFEATLKATTTLFLDMRGDKQERSQLPTEKSVRNYLPPPTHMRRASAVLATIAKSTGIGSFEDWFVV